jgi:hypothetical protein
MLLPEHVGNTGSVFNYVTGLGCHMVVATSSAAYELKNQSGAWLATLL